MSHRPEVDRSFEEFQASGDPRAIAAVYDRVAPELLLLAAHLGHEAADAEDLVQVTFLAAMEQVADWDATRPLLPWLMGILVNQAKRERRRRARTPDPDRLLDAPPSVDPVQAAAQSEFADEFARKLAALPENYRQALTLRWVHGLSPVEIAHTLGVSPETVKTRLRRGTDILRQALPAGFAAAAVGMATPTRGLAAVRDVVVRRAEELQALRGPAPATTSTTPTADVGGGTATAGTNGVVRALLGGITGAALVLGGVWALGVFDDASTPTAADRVVDDRSPRAAATAADRSGRDRVDTSTPTPSGSDGGLPAARITIAFADGAPAGGAAVGLRRRGAANPLLHPRWFVADDAGRVEVDTLAVGTWDVTVQRGGAAWFTVAEPGVATAACRVVVPDGIDVAGTVRAAGEPLVGARVWLSNAEQPDEGHVVATTGADGTFALRDVAPGRAYSVLADGCVPRPLAPLVGAVGTTAELAIDMSSQVGGFSLAGRVVDEAGAPLAGALVQIGRRLPYLDFDNAAMGEHSRLPPLVLTTDGDGRFAHDALVVFGRELDVWARLPGRPAAYALAEFPGKHADVTLTLPRGATVRGRVAGLDGRPVVGARVVVRDVHATEDFAFAPRWVGSVAWTDDDGVYELPGLPAGALSASVSGPEGRRAVRELVAEGPGAVVVWDAVVGAPRGIRGDVVDAATGQPLVGLSVRALVPKGRNEPPAVTTDELGRFAFDDCDDAEHTLWVTDPQSPWNGRLTARAGVLAGTSGLRLAVDADRRCTAAITGRVVDARGRPVAAQLSLGHLRVGRAFTENDPETGRFRIEPLPALGPHWDLLTRAKPDGASGWQFALVDAFATARDEATDVGDLVVDAPGRIVVTARHADGSPVTDGVLRIARAATLLHWVTMDVTDGAGRSERVPAGDWIVHFVSETLPQTPTRVTVVAGRESPVDLVVPDVAHVRSFTFDHPNDGWDLRMNLTWCAADGSPRCRDRVQWKHTLPFATRQAFAPGDYVLRATSHTGASAEVRFTVGPDAEGEGPVHVRLAP